MTHTEELIFRLRDTARRSQTAWGDLQQEAADELQALIDMQTTDGILIQNLAEQLSAGRLATELAVAAEREACDEQMREGFEAHIKACIESEGGLMQALQRDAAGDYVTHWVAEKFVTWQAASSKEREACAKVCESYLSESPHSWGGTTMAAAIRARVPPQPVQKPVAWGVFEGNLHDMFFTQEEAREMAALKGHHAEVRPLYTTPPLPEERNFCSRCGKRTADIHTCTPPLPVQEPWDWAAHEYDGIRARVPPLPVQRPWVGLTDDELAALSASGLALWSLWRAIEQALKDKNI